MRDASPIAMARLAEGWHPTRILRNGCWRWQRCQAATLG